MQESKIDLTDRLRREGRWEEASLWNGERIKALQAEGMKSLREAFISNLARGGAHLTMARHSTPELTANVYTTIEADERRRAVDLLPDLSMPMPLAATGTDGRDAERDDRPEGGRKNVAVVWRQRNHWSVFQFSSVQ